MKIILKKDHFTYILFPELEKSTDAQIIEYLTDLYTHEHINPLVTIYNLLAYYYVGFAIAMPEVLNELKLPYQEEYLIAKSWRSSN